MMSIAEHIQRAEELMNRHVPDSELGVRCAAMADVNTNLARLKFEMGMGYQQEEL